MHWEFSRWMLIATISQWLPIFSYFVPVSNKRNVEEHISSKNGSTWWGFKYCMIGWANDHAVLSRKTLTSSGVTDLAISILAVRCICPRTGCTRSNIAFPCGFLTMVGLSAIPFDLHKYSKCSLNSFPLSYTKWQHRGYLHNQVLFTNFAMQSEILSKILLAVSSSLPLTVGLRNWVITGSSMISNQLEAGLIMVRVIKSICKLSLPLKSVWTN